MRFNSKSSQASRNLDFLKRNFVKGFVFFTTFPQHFLCQSFLHLLLKFVWLVLYTYHSCSNDFHGTLVSTPLSSAHPAMFKHVFPKSCLEPFLDIIVFFQLYICVSIFYIFVTSPKKKRVKSFFISDKYLDCQFYYI